MPCRPPFSVSPLRPRRGTMRTCSICIVPALLQQAGSSRSVSPSWSSSVQFPQISGATVVVLVVDDGVAVVDVEVDAGAEMETEVEVVVVTASSAVVVVVLLVLVVAIVLVVGTVLVIVLVVGAGTA